MVRVQVQAIYKIAKSTECNLANLDKVLYEIDKKLIVKFEGRIYDLAKSQHLI